MYEFFWSIWSSEHNFVVGLKIEEVTRSVNVCYAALCRVFWIVGMAVSVIEGEVVVVLKEDIP